MLCLVFIFKDLFFLIAPTRSLKPPSMFVLLSRGWNPLPGACSDLHIQLCNNPVVLSKQTKQPLPLYNGFFQLVLLYYSTLGQHVFSPGHVPRRLRIRKKPFAKVRPVCCFATSKYPAIFSLFKLLNLISNFVFFHRLDLANTSLNIFRLKFFNE